MKKFNKNSIVVIVSVALGLMGPIAALAAGPAAINLGSAGNFTILAKTGISTTGSTSIVGNLGLSPAAASYVTGFGLTMDVSNTFSTSALVTGDIYAADYTAPTPTTMTTAINDMETAYTDGAGRTNPTATELGAGNIGGMTLAPGLYTWGTDLTIPTDVTLSGGANDVWIFQVSGNLVMSSATHIILSGGAQASNVFWIVAGQTTIGTTSAFNGNILDQTTIVLNTGATLNGRALAQAAVTLDSNAVTAPVAATTAILLVACPMLMPYCPYGSYAILGSNGCSQTICNPALTSMSTSTPTYTAVPLFVSTPAASSSENAALQTELSGLMAELQSLQASAGKQGSSVPASAQQVGAIAVNLSTGSTGSNVTILQQFLISQNKGPAAEALARHGTSTYFGALTQAALAEFQASVSITPASGYFGPKTRTYIGSLGQ